MKGYVKFAIFSIVNDVRNQSKMNDAALSTIAKEYEWTDNEKQDFIALFPHVARVVSVKGTAKNNDVRILVTNKGESYCRKFVENYVSIVRENRVEYNTLKDCKNHGEEVARKPVKTMLEEDRIALQKAVESGDIIAIRKALKKANDNAVMVA